MKFLIFASVFLLLQIFVKTQVIVPSCGTSSSCNTLRTYENKYCSSSSCLDYGEAAYKSTPKSTEKCLNSFSFTSRCGAYAAVGCTISTENALHLKCIQGSIDSSRKCVLANATIPAVTYVNLNDRCDTGKRTINETSPRPSCSNGLSCVESVCREQLKEGEFCTGSRAGCISGTTCHLGVCTVRYSLPDLAPCNSNSVCKSGDCSGSGFCVATSANACFSNRDCGSGAVCKKASATSTTDEKGACFNPAIVALGDYNRCQYENCNKDTTLTDASLGSTCFERCKSQFIKLQCASHCTQSPEVRFLSGSPYLYDCTAMTLKKLVDGTDCEIREQFQNCKAVVDYNGSSEIRGMKYLIVATVALAMFFW